MISREQVQELVDEFTNKEAQVTIEFSNSITDLDSTFEILNSVPSKLGSWIAMSCKTCEEYHGVGHVHVSLETHNNVNKMKLCSNFIRA